MEMKRDIIDHIQNGIIPFWESLRDQTNGGYYGFVDYDLCIDKKAVKGCILNSRITWFFANAYLLFQEEHLLEHARHGFTFMKKHCMDPEYGGIYWSVTYDGKIEEGMKHTYNQAFAIYALSSYYDASKDREALQMAYDLFHLIESKCKDENGYLEALSRDFQIIDNDKLSENGVMADRTMNTLLHILEAYTELYRVDHNSEVKHRLTDIIECFVHKVYNPALHRQEVFFDNNWKSLIDLHSYGHDIETAWLMDRTAEVLDVPEITEVITPITRDLTRQIYEVAFDGHSLANECEKGVVNTDRIWWIQAETVVGFLNGYEKDPTRTEYLEAARNTWEYIKEYIIDKREGSEWYWRVREDGTPVNDPIVEPWKCPYHNGRMCLEVIKRLEKCHLPW